MLGLHGRDVEIVARLIPRCLKLFIISLQQKKSICAGLGSLEN